MPLLGGLRAAWILLGKTHRCLYRGDSGEESSIRVHSNDNKVHIMATKQKKQDKALPVTGGKTAAAVAVPAEPGESKVRALGQYFEDAKSELGKVSWPTKKEIKATSIAVLILVVIMSFFLGIVDILLTKIVGAILSVGL